MKLREMTLIAHRTVRICHMRLINMGLTGELPEIDFHYHRDMPVCLYHPRTNVISISVRQVEMMLETEFEERMLDVMTMCGNQRQYLADMRLWNASQNKRRLQTPVLALIGSPPWREIRSKLKE